MNTPWSFEVCIDCGKPNIASFRVADSVWEAVMGVKDGGGTLCIFCFDKRATAEGVDWCEQPVEWFPISTVRNATWGNQEQFTMQEQIAQLQAENTRLEKDGASWRLARDNWAEEARKRGDEVASLRDEVAGRARVITELASRATRLQGEVERLTAQVSGVYQLIRDVDLLAEKQADKDGYIIGYRFNTGAWHRLLGVLAGAELPAYVQQSVRVESNWQSRAVAAESSLEAMRAALRFGQHEPDGHLRFTVEVRGIGAQPYSAMQVAEELCQHWSTITPYEDRLQVTVSEEARAALNPLPPEPDTGA